MSDTATARPVTPVGILSAKLTWVVERLWALDGIDPALMSELTEAADLARGLEPYLSRFTTPESSALEQLARRTEAEDWSRPDDSGAPLEAEMLSGHVEGQLLKMLVHISGARRVLEIGMFTGYSALAMAEALPPEGRVVACEIDPGVAAFAQQCFDASPNGRQIEVRVGPASTTLSELAAAGESFDLVFIDADKPGYLGYLNRVLDGNLLAPAGFICVDNTLMQGQPYLTGGATANGVAIESFNRAVAADRRVDQVIVPLRDGLTLIRRVDEC